MLLPTFDRKIQKKFFENSISSLKKGFLNNRHNLRSILASLLVTLALINFGYSGWIYAKAYLAHILIERAWQQTLKTGENTLPWPWADTWPVARIQAPKQSIDWVVLAGAHGSSLAFAPGHIDGTALPEQVMHADDLHFSTNKSDHRFHAAFNPQQTMSHIALSGHRDTHFAFLQHAQKGDIIRLQKRNGSWLVYRIDHTEIKNIKDGPWLMDKTLPRLSLVTCYPFDALTPGGSERFIVQAIPI